MILLKKLFITAALFFMISSYTVYGEYETINVKVNNADVVFGYGAPFRDSSERIYVPAKDIIPAMGGKMVWLPETDELYVSRGNAKFIKNSTPGDVDLLVGYSDYMLSCFKAGNERIAYSSKNGKNARNVKIVAVDCKPDFYNDTLYIPIRYISNMLGYTVEWDEGSKTVICSDTGTQIGIEDDVPSVSDTESIVRSSLEMLFLTDSLNTEGRNLVYSYFNGTADENEKTDALRIAGMVKYKTSNSLAEGYYTDGNFGGFISALPENDSVNDLIKEIALSEGATEEFISYMMPATEDDIEFLQQYFLDLSIIGL